MQGLGSGGQGGRCSTAPCVWPGQLSAFTEGTIEEKQAGCTKRLTLGPAESVLLAMAWPGSQSHVGVLARSPNSSSSWPCLTSHHVLATFQSLLNSERHYPLPAQQHRDVSQLPGVAARCVCPQGYILCRPPRRHLGSLELPGQWLPWLIKRSFRTLSKRPILRASQ